MRLLLLSLITMIISNGVGMTFAQGEQPFKNPLARLARSKYELTLKQTQVEYDRLIERQRKELAAAEKKRALADAAARKSYIANLEKAKIDATKKGMLEDALAIKAEIERYGSSKGTKITKGKNVPASAVELKNIPGDAKEFQGHHYKIFRKPMTWHVARDKCKEMGGHLLRIESPREQRFVANNLLDLSTNEVLWMDGSDELKEGNWRFGNGEKVSFFEWHKGYPRDEVYRNHLNINSKLGGAWGNVPAGYRWGFICEWD